MRKSPRMNARNWSAAIAQLPPRLSIRRAARALKASYNFTRLLLLRHGYAYVKEHAWGQRERRKFNPNRINWSKHTNNAALAKKYGMSRERVRQLRQKLSVKT